jgi:hypothetical protein
MTTEQTPPSQPQTAQVYDYRVEKTMRAFQRLIRRMNYLSELLDTVVDALRGGEQVDPD